MFDPYGTPVSISVGDGPRHGEGRARRLARTASQLLERPRGDINTTWDIINYCAETYGAEPGMAYRTVEAVMEEEKVTKRVAGGKTVVETKKSKYFRMSEFKYLSFAEVQDAAAEVAKGLLTLGIRKEDVFSVYAQTSLEWQLITQGCAAISTTVATAYASLGEKDLTHSLNEPECVGIFTHTDLLPILLNVLPNVPTLRLVVYDGAPSPALLEKLSSVRGTEDHLVVLSLSELRTRGSSLGSDTDLRARHPSSRDVALIAYTAGTTGTPKGVAITHANLTAVVGSVDAILGPHVAHGQDTYLAHRPLAYVLEFVLELVLLYNGLTVGFGRPETLFDGGHGNGNGGGLLRDCRSDLVAFRPTMMVGAPEVWESVREVIERKVGRVGVLGQAVFGAAMGVKRARVPVLSAVADAVVLSQVRAATGGRLRLALSEGSAISRETQEFLSLSLVTVLQGYGVTESCGMCVILPPEKYQYGVAGVPVPSVEVKLIDVEEAGYRSSNRPPQGEIALRGTSVVKGYYKRPDLNSDEGVFTRDGWFRTGDVGQWNEDGTLSIIGRIESLVKLQDGEYIALERLESVYKACALVAMVCVHGDASAKQPIGIVCPDEGNLRRALGTGVAIGAALLGLNRAASFAELCQTEEAREVVLRECNAIGRRAGLSGKELLGAVVLTAEAWTAESGLVTATRKVRREKVVSRYEAGIKAIYKRQ